MNVEQARFNMIEQQIRTWEVLNPEVLDLLFVVKREQFVPPAWRALAFADLELPLGHGQRMLAPRIEARLLQEIGLRQGDRVLEIGTGSGYMAALLATQAATVVSVERIPELAASARANLANAGVSNVRVETGNAVAGWPEAAPYDAILVSGAMPSIPAALCEQLAPGGRLLAVVGQAPAMQVKLVVRNGDRDYVTTTLFETVIPELQDTVAEPAFAF